MQPATQSVTLKDIAEAAGVSKVTVSRALRNQVVLPEQTRRRIQGIAQEMGYLPDPRISELMARLRSRRPNEQKSTLAVIWDSVDEVDWSVYQNGANKMAGVRGRANELGFNLNEIFLGNGKLTGRQVSRILWNRGITGVIILTLKPPNSTLDLDWRLFSTVALTGTISEPGLPRVCTDHFDAMLTIMSHLRQRNYRRIGLAISAQMDGRVEHRWRAGYLVHHSLHPPANRIPMFVPSKMNRGDFEQWLRTHQPDAIVGGGDHDLVLRWLRELKLRLPEDLGYVNCHLKEASPSAESLSGMCHCELEKGAAAVDLLVNQLQSDQRGLCDHPRTLLLPARWVEGKTIRPA